MRDVKILIGYYIRVELGKVLHDRTTVWLISNMNYYQQMKRVVREPFILMRQNLDTERQKLLRLERKQNDKHQIVRILYNWRLNPID